MPTLRITPEEFWVDGRKALLMMGELHYFRMPRESWQPALERLKESGCNAVAYYVPWFVHQPEADVFDFDGRLHPQHDLRHWIALTKELGLIGFLRPGPYVYAETTDLGIPKWFSAAHGQAGVQSYRDGVYLSGSRINCVAHRNPDFLKAVQKWIRALAEVIRQDIAPTGNIAMIQLCNEIPCDDHDDRNPINLGIGQPEGLYPTYLKRQYGSVEALNQAYGTDFAKLETIEPHQLEQANAPLYADERLRYYYTFYYPGYFRILHDMFTECGIDAYFTHNAYNPRAVSLHTWTRRENPWLQIGLDCYFSLNGALSITDATYYCEYGAEYARRFLKCVPWVAEQECGYWNDYPRVYGPELYLWNLWTFAAGYRGINMYMFASGVNLAGMGFYGTAHSWQAPLDERGMPRASYEWICRSLREAKQHEHTLMEESAYDIALYVKDQPGLIWTPLARLSNETYFALRQAGYTPRMTDLADEQAPCNVMVVVCNALMAEAMQRKLLQFVRKGGRLLLVGAMPVKDENRRPCTVLADELGILAEGGELEPCEQEKLVLGGKEYYLGMRVQPLTVMDEQVIARTPDGRVAVARARTGKMAVLSSGLNNMFVTTAELLGVLLHNMEAYPSIQGAVDLRVILKKNGHAVALNPAPVSITETLTLWGKTFALTLPPYGFEVLEEVLS